MYLEKEDLFKILKTPDIFAWGLLINLNMKIAILFFSIIVINDLCLKTCCTH
jgi:hypothetical protein